VDLKLEERHIKRAQPTLSTYTLSLCLLLRSYPATHALSLRLPPSRTHLLHGHTHISLSLMAASLSPAWPHFSVHARSCRFLSLSRISLSHGQRPPFCPPDVAPSPLTTSFGWPTAASPCLYLNQKPLLISPLPICENSREIL
jgi:hypothetical protein